MIESNYNPEIDALDTELLDYRETSEHLATFSTEQDVMDGPDLDPVEEFNGTARGFLSTPKRVPLAPRETQEAMLWLKKDRDRGNDNWNRKCLVRARQARGIPAVYPTARAAGLATPKSERVYKIDDLKRGMVIFTYDARHPGSAGHVASVLGRDKERIVICDSNDVVSNHPGATGIVRLNFFEEHWGHTFMFGATMLNGYDFKDFNAAPKRPKGVLGSDYDNAIENMERIVHRKQAKLGASHPLVKALKVDLAHMIKMKDLYPVEK